MFNKHRIFLTDSDSTVERGKFLLLRTRQQAYLSRILMLVVLYVQMKVFAACGAARSCHSVASQRA